MKKFVLLLLFIMPIALVVIISFAGRIVSLTQYIKVESMQIFCSNNEELELLSSSKGTTTLKTVKKGEQLNLDVVIRPDISTDKKFTLQIDSPDYVSVTEDGNHITLSANQITTTPVTVTATSADSHSIKARFNVMVLPNGVEEIKFSKSLIRLYRGETKEIASLITVTTLPIGAQNTIIWSVEDTDIADLSASLPTYIVAKEAGNTNLIATAVDGGLTAKCQVEVLDSALPIQFNFPANQSYTLTDAEKQNGFDLTGNFDSTDDKILLLLDGIVMDEIEFTIIQHPERAEINGTILRRISEGLIRVRATVSSQNEEYGGLYADITIKT